MSLDAMMPWELQSELHKVVSKGDVSGVLSVVKLLSKCGNIDSLNKMKKTPLLVAVELGHTEIAAVLVTSEADVNEGKPVEAAVVNNQPKLVSLLCSAGASVSDHLSGYGISLLEFAIAKKFQKVSEILTYYSAEKSFELASQSEIHVRNLLIKREVKSFNKLKKQYFTESKSALEQSKIASQKRRVNAMILTACSDNLPDLLLDALRETPDVVITRDLVKKCICDGSLEIVIEVMNNFDISTVVGDTDQHGFNCLFYAVQNGDMKMFELVADCSPSLLQSIDNEGHSLVHWAAYCGHYNIVVVLITKYKVVPHAVDRSGRTCLHWLVQSDADELSILRIISYLIKHFPTLITTKDLQRKTALDIAEQTLSSPSIKKLVTPVMDICDRRL